MIDPEAAVPVGPASPPSDPHQISSDPEPDADDWDNDNERDRSGVSAAPSRSFELDEVDWDEINDEVDAAMNESDDDDDEGDEASEKSGMRSGNASEDEWTDESNSMIRFASLVVPLCFFRVQCITDGLRQAAARHQHLRDGKERGYAVSRRQKVVALTATRTYFVRR